MMRTSPRGEAACSLARTNVKSPRVSARARSVSGRQAASGNGGPLTGAPGGEGHLAAPPPPGGRPPPAPATPPAAARGGAAPTPPAPPAGSAFSPQHDPSP